MDKCIGLINSGFTDETFGTLCKTRPPYMLPFGGRYRIIDFALSTMTNHNITSVVLYSSSHMRSTLDHIGDGQPWELNRKVNGIVIFPPSYDRKLSYHNDITNYYSTLKFYEDSNLETIYYDNPMNIVNINLEDAYNYFLDNDLDVLFLYRDQKDEGDKYLNVNKLILDSEGKLLNLGVNLGTEEVFHMYIGKLFIKKSVFIDLVKSSVEKADAESLREAIVVNKDKLKIGTYKIENEVGLIRNLKTYYDESMTLLDMEVYHSLFFENNLIYTKSKDEPSTLYSEDSKVTNSLIANGCIIEGEVENSIIFRGVKVGKGAVIKNSIIMQKSMIGDGARLENTVIDKYGVVGDSVSLIGSPSQPYVLPKARTVRGE